MKKVEYYEHTNGKIPVKEWLKNFDISVRMRFYDRLLRIEENNNFGDFKNIDSEISELRFKFGSGYRIYYAEIDNIVVLLLNAGDKKRQSNDIQKAKEYLEIWRNAK